MPKVSVKETEAPTEIIADSIVSISEGIRKLRSGRLNDRSIVILIHHVCGIGQREIRSVLDAMETLESNYLKKRAS